MIYGYQLAIFESWQGGFKDSLKYVSKNNC